MKKKKTQLLGIVLSAAMLATSVPAPVYAEPTDNVAEEEDSDAAAVQETTDEADAVADDATDDSTAADDATPEEADEQDTADEADAQAAEEGDNEVKVDGGYTISIPTINFQGANAAVAEQMAKDGMKMMFIMRSMKFMNLRLNRISMIRFLQASKMICVHSSMKRLFSRRFMSRL